MNYDQLRQLVDENPYCWLTKLVLADYCEEQTLPEASFWRWTGEKKICALGGYGEYAWFNQQYFIEPNLYTQHCTIPDSLFNLLYQCEFGTRYEADEALKQAFLKLHKVA